MTDPGTESAVRDMTNALFLTPAQRLPQPYYQDDWATLYLGDCRDLLPALPMVDLVCIDPPYGIGKSQAQNQGQARRARLIDYDYGKCDWDKQPIASAVLLACLAKGTWQACFGGNYYPLPPSSCWLVWDKLNGANDYADGELVWTNFPKPVRIIRYRWHGMIRQGNEDRFHPTQKPLAVMVWALGHAPVSHTVADFFAGSGTTLVAAKQLGLKAIGVEIEETYCRLAAERLRHTTPTLFPPPQTKEPERCLIDLRG